MQKIKSRAYRIVKILAATGIVLLLFSCASTYDYTAYKESRPRSILVMPPVNLSPEVDGPAAYLATSAWPLAESGYYVIPVTLSDLLFKQNGVTVAEEAQAIDYRKLHEIFGADSAMYIKITNYGTRFILVNSVVEAEAEARLIDLRTGQELWSGTAKAEYSGGASTSGLGLLGAIATAAVNQAVNTITDKAYDVGKQANHRMLSAGRTNGILYGPYHPKYQTD
jgi:hypothetical protein